MLPLPEHDAPPSDALPRDSICAVIVTYHPDRDFPSRVGRISEQAGSVVVVDNGSGQEAHEMLASLAAQPNVSVVFNPANLGIAAALNQGAQWALAHGFLYLLLFDQDTVVQENLRDVYGKIYREINSGEKGGSAAEAILGANFWQSRDGQVAKKIKPASIPAGSSGLWANAVVVLTSGTLLPRTVWEKVGPFRDDFFIDGVDEEYCLRARRHGVRILISTAPLMQHSIGDQSRYRFLWKQGWTYNYSPLRHYCRTRNSVAIWRGFFRHQPRWVLSHVLFTLKIFTKICLYEAQKGPKLRGLGLGLLDGLRGRFDLLTARMH